MPSSRRSVFVRMVILASCIAAAGELPAQPKTPVPDADAQLLLKIALDMAAGTGDAATALQAVERLLEQFDEPAAELIGDTLLTAARQATTSAQHKAVAEAVQSIAAKLSGGLRPRTWYHVVAVWNGIEQRLYAMANAH